MGVEFLKLKDLMKPCSSCGGTGDKNASDEENQGHSFGQLRIPTSRVGYCNACEGRGWSEFTEAGTVLLSFIQKIKGRGLL